MLAKIRDFISEKTYRPYTELPGIIYFLVLAILCLVEFLKVNPSVTVPVAVPMIFNLLSLQVALVFSFLINSIFILLDIFKSQFKSQYERKELEIELPLSGLMFFFLLWSIDYISLHIDMNYSQLFLSGSSKLFIAISALEIVVRAFPQSIHLPMKSKSGKDVIEWLKNIRRSYGVAIPIFIYLILAGYLQNDLVIILGVIACSILVVKSFVNIQRSIFLRTILVIILSVLFAAVLFSIQSYSEVHLILFSLLIHYIILSIDRIQNWHVSNVINRDYNSLAS